MKCPCCGKEMVMDAHTKIDKYMCYECGYVEGRLIPAAAAKPVVRSKVWSFSNAFTILARGLGVAMH